MLPVAVLIAIPSLYHWLPLADDDVSVTLPPAQNVVAVVVDIIGVDGIGLTVTVVADDADDEHPLVVTITV